MIFLKKIQLSSVAILIIAITCFIIDLSFKNWEKQKRVIEYDVHSYYAYLPAKFIYDDIKIEKSNYQFGDDYYFFWPSYINGKAVIKTTMGLSIMYAPFFFVAHWYATVSDYPENGFSEPYKIFLLLSSVFYLILGLDFLRKVLKIFLFSDANIAITLLLIGLGTNLLCYASQSATMAHAYNFCLFAIFIYYTIKWHQDSSIKNTLVLGLLLGLISLIRPSNAIIILFFFLYGISNLQELKQRLLFFRKEFFLLALICFFAIIVWVPQFIYWKTVTGNYFFYSFTDERFFFDRPRIILGLFSFRKGWLVYTPIMVFSIMGFFINNPVFKKVRWSIVLFFTLNIYVILSWWCWWYGGTFGQRAMIESYALLSIPFAYFVQFVFNKNWFVKSAFIVVCSFFIWLNIFQIYQYEKLTLHWEGMTKELYFKQFGKLEKIPDYDKYVSYPDFAQAKKGNSFGSGPSYDQPKKIEVQQNSVVFLAANNKYVCAESDSLLYANKEIANSWETFTLKELDKDVYSIQAYTGLFLSTDLKNENRISASGKDVGDREKYIIVDLGNGFVALKASNNKFLSVDELKQQLFAKSDTIGNRERFLLKRL